MNGNVNENGKEIGKISCVPTNANAEITTTTTPTITADQEYPHIHTQTRLNRIRGVCEIVRGRGQIEHFHCELVKSLHEREAHTEIE